MLGFEGLLVLATGAMLVSSGHWAIFLGAALMAGFCHGANFAIYPTTLARLYGPELLGTTYPWVMVAQGISSVAPLVGGAMWAATGGFQAALGVSAGVAVLGLGLSAWLGHAQQLAPQSPLRIVQPLSASEKPDVESAK
jgi:MFS family permease